MNGSRDGQPGSSLLESLKRDTERVMETMEDGDAACGAKGKCKW